MFITPIIILLLPIAIVAILVIDWFFGDNDDD